MATLRYTSFSVLIVFLVCVKYIKSSDTKYLYCHVRYIHTGDMQNLYRTFFVDKYIILSYRSFRWRFYIQEQFRWLSSFSVICVVICEEEEERRKQKWWSQIPSLKQDTTLLIIKFKIS